MNKTYKKLYRVTNMLGTFFVVAPTFDEAADILLALLDQSDYGFSSQRTVPIIEHVASQHFYFNDTGKQSFSDGIDSLIVVGDGCEPSDAGTTEELAAVKKLLAKTEEKAARLESELKQADECVNILQLALDNERSATCRKLQEAEIEHAAEVKRLEDYIRLLLSQPVGPSADVDPKRPKDEETPQSGEEQPIGDNGDDNGYAPHQPRLKNIFNIGDIIVRRDNPEKQYKIEDIKDNRYICNGGEDRISYKVQRKYEVVMRRDD